MKFVLLEYFMLLKDDFLKELWLFHFQAHNNLKSGVQIDFWSQLCDW